MPFLLFFLSTLQEINKLNLRSEEDQRNNEDNAKGKAYFSEHRIEKKDKVRNKIIIYSNLRKKWHQ